MPHSLCSACSWMRITYGKLGQHYLLCRNDAVPAKYPPQPVGRCAGFALAGAAAGAHDAPADPVAPEPGSVGGEP